MCSSLDLDLNLETEGGVEVRGEGDVLRRLLLRERQNPKQAARGVFGMTSERRSQSWCCTQFFFFLEGRFPEPGALVYRTFITVGLISERNGFVATAKRL